MQSESVVRAVLPSVEVVELTELCRRSQSLPGVFPEFIECLPVKLVYLFVASCHVITVTVVRGFVVRAEKQFIGILEKGKSEIPTLAGVKIFDTQ